MAIAVKTLIKKAMQKAGVLTKNQVMTADEAQDACDALNGMLASWSNDTMLVFVRTWEYFPLVGGKANYTMGAGGDFNTVRPGVLIDAYSRQDNNNDQPIKVINDELWDQIPQKNAPGLPQVLNYDGGYPLATIKLNPVPTSSLWQIFLLSEKPLGTFTINQMVDLPYGWERALIFNLAMEIFSDYYGSETQPNPLVVKIATDSQSLIRKAIQKTRDFDAYPTQVSPNNIYTGYNN